MGFAYKNRELFCEDVAVSELAQKYGTPLYVYSHTDLKNQFALFDHAFGSSDHLVCYSMKANSSAAVLKTFIGNGSGIDVVTGGELYRALKAGCPPQKIVFSGVGKSDEEIRAAISANILQFNVESEEELENIQALALALGKKAPIALRVNPDVDPKTHAYISTGLKKSKFGISHEEALRLYHQAGRMSHLAIVGIDCHIGSQLTEVSPFVAAAQKIRSLVLELKKSGIEIKNWDMGGGLGITYDQEKPPSPAEYAKALLGAVGDLKIKLIFEPGRYLVGNSSVLLTRVIYGKKRDVKNFVVVDAASNDLMRPSLYDAYHEIVPVVDDASRPKVRVDIVGPICETGDFLAQGRSLATVKRGELLAVKSVGAYGFSMSSTYNSRPRSAEVMVKGCQHALIRQRETVADLVKGELIPEFLGG